jgi:hypothetical protein
LVNAQNTIVSLAERASILTDMKKLKDYIISLKKNVSIFNNIEVKIVKAQIKPEYLEYIKLYGYPSNGVFDMDKLGAILVSMELENLI